MNDEIRLIRKVQKNADKDAADILIRKYYDEIYKYVYKQASDKHSALDLTQEIFISMFRTINLYDNKKAGFRTWLYRIATNKIIDHHRSRAVSRTQILNLDDFDIADEENFARQIEDSDLILRIKDYIGTFEADIQRIFRLKVFGEYTFAEIAKMTELSEPTAKTKYYRTMKILRKEFQHEYNS